ncbi:MAG TPA: penicillin acylase family protein, partial [Pyrinomonadaceae bacterium]|nr:penicillin acylase family protein [Pyrinomonadaceae bacterium]
MRRSTTVNLAVVLLCLFGSSVPSLRGQQAGTAASSAPTQLKIAGLQERVTVRRDERGIPYIQAGNDHDLYFAQGYFTASDRLWQMDVFRRNARGELAEIFGAAALEEDKRHRTFGFAQVAEAESAQASPQARGILEAYADGVNAYIASLDAKTTPPEFQLLQYKPKP